MRYRHVVFDVDGTLVDTEYCIIRALQDTLTELTGHTPPAEELAFCFGITGEDAVKRLPCGDPNALLERWTENMGRYAHTAGLFPGVAELLTALKGAGCSLGVATSRIHAEFDGDMAQSGLGPLFDRVVCADDTETHKPQPGPLLKYMEWTGAKPGGVLYVGDSIYDSQCAQGAGVDFALAVWGSHTLDRPAKYYPKTPAELLTLIS